MKKLLLVSIFLLSLFIVACGSIPYDPDKPKGLISVPVSKIIVEQEPEEKVEEEPKEEKPVAEKITGKVVEEVPDSEYYTLAVNETNLVKPKLEAKDPDGDPVTYYFFQPLNSNGEWQTKIGDKGTYKTKIIASDGKTNTTLYLKIVVSKFNRAPILATIEDITVNEGDTVILSPKAVDPDNDSVNITISGWMSSTRYKTNYNDAGAYIVTVSASDGIYTTKQDVTITVNNVNRVPVISKIDDVTVTEGELVKVDIIATDPDNDKVDVTVFGPVSEKGEWQTKLGDKGTYNIRITANDGKDTTETSFKVTVNQKNRAPEFEQIKDITINEGEKVEILVKANDPEGQPLTYKINDKNFLQERNLFTWQTDYEDGGQEQVIYDIRITISDGINEASQDIKVTVKNVNRAPVFKFG